MYIWTEKLCKKLASFIHSCIVECNEQHPLINNLAVNKNLSFFAPLCVHNILDNIPILPWLIVFKNQSDIRHVYTKHKIPSERFFGLTLGRYFTIITIFSPCLSRKCYAKRRKVKRKMIKKTESTPKYKTKKCCNTSEYIEHWDWDTHKGWIICRCFWKQYPNHPPYTLTHSYG